MKILSAIAIIFILFAPGTDAQVASGGVYTLNQAVIASGGGTSSDGGVNYRVEGTSGQSLAGTFSYTSPYSVRGGFWSPNPFAPTAAGVTVGGRVVTAGGIGIRNVTVTLIGGSMLVSRTARTSSFGHFTFEDVEVGHIYTITVKSRKYVFEPPSRVLSLQDNVGDLLFQASWEN